MVVLLMSRPHQNTHDDNWRFAQRRAAPLHDGPQATVNIADSSVAPPARRPPVIRVRTFDASVLFAPRRRRPGDQDEREDARDDSLLPRDAQHTRPDDLRLHDDGEQRRVVEDAHGQAAQNI